MTFESRNARKHPVGDPPEEVFPQYEIASWAPDGGQKIVFPVTEIIERGGNRLVERERPYRDGAKLDDTGRKAARWDMTAYFLNSIEEAGLEWNGEVLYPNVLNWLIDSFSLHTTGNLIVPTRGEVRARAESYERSETTDVKDGAILRLSFIEDNEDSVDARSLGMPTVNATAVQLAERAQFSAFHEATWYTSFQDLVHFAAQIEGLANAPREYARELHDKANMLRAAHERIVRAFSSRTVPGRGTFLDPAGNRTERRLVMLSDQAGRSRATARGNQPKSASVVFEHDQSLASIASMLGLSFEDLLYANPQLENPGYVPRGAQVLIPENAKIARHS